MAGEMDHAKKSGSGLIATLKQGFSMGGGGVFGSSGGIIPGLANISSIIRGIPQIGQLAHAIVSPLTDAAEEGVRLNIRLEQAEIAFTNVAGSAEKAHNHIMSIQAFGARSPFRFEGLLDGVQLMNTFGFSLDEQLPKLRIWGDAIASSGKLSEEAVMRVITAFGQMRISGRVNAQDMMQLTNANIDGWGLLAKAIGKTVAETRKMAEAGKLNGRVAVEAITAMMAIDPRYKDMMSKLEKTTGGRLSAVQDMLQIAQGTATKGTTANFGQILQDFLDKPDLLPMLAAKINSVLTPISGLIETGVKTILGGGITTGLVDGLQFGKDAVKKAVVDMAGDSIIGSFKNMLGIGSPSTVFIGFGINSAKGYRDGILSGLNTVSGEIMGGFNDVLDQVEGLLQSRNKRLLQTQERSKSNLERLIQREPDFLQKLIAGSRTRGMNPDHLLNVMAVETAGSFNPQARNPNSSASGLIQFMRETARTLGTTVEAIRKMSGTQQLDYVFKYFDQYIRKFGPLDTQGKVYAAVGAGRVGANDDSVIMRRGDRGYEGNKATWDRNLDGLVRQSEMALAAVTKLGAGVTFTVNGGPVATGNPMPVVFAGVAGNAGSSDTHIGGYHNVPKRVSRAQASGLMAMTAESQDLSGNVFSEPDLLPQINTDISKIKVNLRPLVPMVIESAEQAERLAEEMAKAGDSSTKLGAGQWYEAATAIGSMQQRLSEFNDTLPKTKILIEDIFISIPSRFGDIVGNAVARADGTIQGFWADIKEGFLNTVQGMLGEAVSMMATKGLTGIFQAVLGTPEMDPNTGEATGEVKGGVGWIQDILGWFGIGAGGGSSTTGTATNANTTATQANTIAVTQLTSAITASSVTGGAGGGGGIIGQLLGAALGGLIGGIGGGFAGGKGGLMPGTEGKAFARGGRPTPGMAALVGDDPLGRPNPEIFIPDTAGTVVPLNKLGGNFTLNLTQVIQAPNGRVAPESAEQAAMKTVAAVSRFTQQRGGNI